jgi:hypothetical protein
MSRADRPSLYPALDAVTRETMVARQAEVIAMTHGGNLTEAQSRELLQTVQAHADAIERLRRFGLTNADEPAFVLSQEASR